MLCIWKNLSCNTAQVEGCVWKASESRDRETIGQSRPPQWYNGPITLSADRPGGGDDLTHLIWPVVPRVLSIMRATVHFAPHTHFSLGKTRSQWAPDGTDSGGGGKMSSRRFQFRIQITPEAIGKKSSEIW